MQYLSVDEAFNLILSCLRPLTAVPVAMGAALGRVLAEDVRSPLNIPPFANAAMDGYAVRAIDTSGAAPDQPARLRLVGEVAAGQVCPLVVEPGQDVRIMTGAMLPQGADAVVRFEDTHEGLYGRGPIFSTPASITAATNNGTGTTTSTKPEEVRVYVPANPGLNVLAEPVSNHSGRRNFLRGKMGLPGTSLCVWPAETHKSSQLASLIESDCLIVAHEERSYYAPGERIGIIPLYGLETGLSNFGYIKVDLHEPHVFELSLSAN
jgi:molybdopterin biosynthesis enzyme